MGVLQSLEHAALKVLICVAKGCKDEATKATAWLYDSWASAVWFWQLAVSTAEPASKSMCCGKRSRKRSSSNVTK